MAQGWLPGCWVLLQGLVKRPWPHILSPHWERLINSCHGKRSHGILHWASSNSSTCLLNMYLFPCSDEDREDLESKVIVLAPAARNGDASHQSSHSILFDQLHPHNYPKELQVRPNLEISQFFPPLSPSWGWWVMLGMCSPNSPHASLLLSLPCS